MIDDDFNIFYNNPIIVNKEELDNLKQIYFYFVIFTILFSLVYLYIYFI